MVQFPPLMKGIKAPPEVDPFWFAQQQAIEGCDAGLVAYNLSPKVLRAAIVFAPEVPLSQAVAMLPTCAVGFQNALGALAPPEVAVHVEWQGGLRLNGARCGRFDMAASTSAPSEVPDWLVIGISFPIWPADSDGGKPPDETALYNEGCAEVNVETLLESWARHSLVWINRWQDDGPAIVHREWTGLAWRIGEDIDYLGRAGKFIGVDENFGLLLQTKTSTELIPLTALLER